MKKADNFDASKWLVENKITSQSKLNEEYESYKGGAGPDEDQQEKNTKTLGVLLKKDGIPFIEDREYAKELWGSPDLVLKIKNPKNNDFIYVSYDRFGFVVDGDGVEDEGLDQEDLKTTIKYIRNLYK
jgi:hypothetical protein